MAHPLNIGQPLKDLFGTKALNFLFFVFLSFFLTACHLSSPTMTSMAFERIPLGASVIEVEEQAGTPYRIKSKGDVKTYYYIERIQIGPNQNAQNTYTLVVKDGKVIDKGCSNESRSLNLQVR